MLKLLLARHGNTFDKGDVIRRVGLRTDIPLSTSGKAQAVSLGEYLTRQNILIDKAYFSELQRTKETASLVLEVLNQSPSQEALSFLNEIDYGIDDGQPESSVQERLGKQALEDWENHMRLPEGWLFDPKQLKTDIANTCARWIEKSTDTSSTYLIVSSNGILRFFPSALNISNIAYPSLKMKTGHVSLLEYDKSGWSLKYWNISPLDT